MTKSERLSGVRKILCVKAKRDFWVYCRVLASEFYKYEHLREYCESLQAFHEDRVQKVGGEWKVVGWRDRVSSCKQMLVQMPPRMGKTRTMTLFMSWVLGLSPKTKFMYTSYNDDAAADTSRFVRDTISEEKLDVGRIVYSDIFGSRLQRDNKAVGKWALEGQFFNMIASGIDGSVTGKGCNYLVVDDPIKSAKDALSELSSERIWQWYTDTLLSRLEEGGKIIVIHTRWPRKDLIQRIKEKKQECYEVVMPAYDGERMLCEELLSKESFEQKRMLLDEAVFEANYQQNVIDEMGHLYRMFRTYHVLPEYPEERRIMVDVADEGDNYLCGIVYDVLMNRGYVVDVLYTQDPVEVSTPLLVEMIDGNEVHYAKFESNNGGKNLALDVERRLQERGSPTVVDWERTTSNKITRIITNSGLVQSCVVFPVDWKEKWPEFAKHVLNYKRIGKNRFDDAPDTLTMIAEDFQLGGVLVYGNKDDDWSDGREAVND